MNDQSLDPAIHIQQLGVAARDAARGLRLDIAAGTAVRFEPGQAREVNLIPFSGARKIYGFNQKVMGAL